jgi:quercetin dioxygenase-like cupin family protein
VSLADQEGDLTMEIADGHRESYQQGDAARFSGQVWLSPGLSAPQGAGMTVVHFGAGARTHWHRHPGGQLLYVVSGRGRVRSRDDEGHLLMPGEIVYISPEEWHFHGGGPDSPMAHVAVSMGGAPEWGDPVTDQEYGEGF